MSKPNALSRVEQKAMKLVLDVATLVRIEPFFVNSPKLFPYRFEVHNQHKVKLHS
jgi:hypothetical protein